MEYLLIKFRESRPVIIDDYEQGETNKVIELPGGRHAVSLGGRRNFSPPEQIVTLSNTSSGSPYVLSFA